MTDFTISDTRAFAPVRDLARSRSLHCARRGAEPRSSDDPAPLEVGGHRFYLQKNQNNQNNQNKHWAESFTLHNSLESLQDRVLRVREPCQQADTHDH